ncbi:Choline transport-like protein [Cladobotryum mycophilum]|uniref:Choline transport-like protein n=1 Tax=Cladobotryum mycophilum TaxID=491253 RepID=A0ABR0SIL4_9HYPO
MGVEREDKGRLAAVNSKDYHNDIAEVSSNEEKDRDQLARLGKKSVLKRTFSFLSILSFTCTVLITWEGSLVLFSQGLTNGGPAGVVYGFLFVWLGNASLFATLSELVSMAPTSGGQYHWVAMLAPRSCSKFLSYVTGWLTAAGWLGTMTAAANFSAGMIQGVAVLTIPSYEIKPYQTTLLFWAVMLFYLLVNTAGNKILPRFETIAFFLHVLGFIGILIPFAVLGSRSTTASVFTTFQNGGNWSSQGLSFFIGLLGNVFAFAGVDGAFHLSEEVQNPSTVVPSSIMFSILINGSAGFIMVVVVLLYMGDIDQALHSPTGFAFMEIFRQATRSVAGSAAMASVVIVMTLCCGAGILASTSRIFWSFSRDRGLPFSHLLSKVDTKKALPYWSIFVPAIIGCLLALINIGSIIAFNSVVSLSVSSLYSSYFLAAILLLYRRCSNGFKSPDQSDNPALANTAGADLVWGPWRIPGILGILNNIFACVYAVIIWFFSFWPVQTPVHADSMNYSVLMTGTAAVFSIGYYLVWAKRQYQGPIVDAR